MNRKPTQLKLAQGTLRKQRINHNEPMPSNDLVAMPDYVLGDAVAIWQEMEQRLKSVGLLTNLDIDALAMYCISRARYEKAIKKLAEEGELHVTPNGLQQASPWLSIANKAHEQMTKKGAEFGLSPSTRSGVEVAKPKQRRRLDLTSHD